MVHHQLVSNYITIYHEPWHCGLWDIYIYVYIYMYIYIYIYVYIYIYICIYHYHISKDGRRFLIHSRSKLVYKFITPHYL